MQRRRILAGDAPEYDTLGKGTTAQTACTVDTTTNLTGRKKTGNGAVLKVDNLGF